MSFLQTLHENPGRKTTKDLPFAMSANNRHSFTFPSKLTEARDENKREQVMPTPSLNTQFMAADNALAASEPTPLPSRMALVVRIPRK
jgi:hypothetical protein